MSTQQLEHVTLILVVPYTMQVHASAQHIRLVTFDADGTLYADGAHMAQDNRMIQVRSISWLPVLNDLQGGF